MVFSAVTVVACEKPDASINAQQVSTEALRQVVAAQLARKAEREASETQTWCAENIQAALIKAKLAMSRGEPYEAYIALHRCKDFSVEVAALHKKADAAEKVIRERANGNSEKTEKSDRKKRGVSLGMSKQEVLDSKWGRPQSVNRTISAQGTHEQWVYGRNYLYFEDGVLTTIQN